MICKNCGHEIEFYVGRWYHIDFEGRKKGFSFLFVRCFEIGCICINPEPGEESVGK